MSHISQLQCVTCQKTFSPEEIDYTCPDCGPISGTLEVQYHYDLVTRELTREKLKSNQNFTHWRYLPLLPIDKPEHISPLAVGWTPLYPVPSLEDEWDLDGLWIKDDGRNPSASYKDRASSIAIVKALEKGVTTVTAASTGNAASSWSAFTALANMKNYIFVPRGAPKGKVAQLLLYGAEVIEVQGNYDQAYDLCCEAADKWGWYNRSTAINPYLGEGKKTGALEICEQLQWNVPDYVFVSVGDGCIFQGVWKGFRDLHEIGLIEKLPRMIGVQAEGSAPLVKAWREGDDTSTPMEPHTVADSISVGVPRDQVKALQAVRQSKGQMIDVSDEAILNAIPTVAQKAGVLAEPAAAAAMAGLIKMVEQGQLPPRSSAVVMLTGHGLKDIDGVLKAVDRRPTQVEPDLTKLESIIQS